MGQISAREDIQTHLAQLISSQHERLNLVASYEINKKWHFLVTEPHVDQLHRGDVAEIEEG